MTARCSYFDNGSNNNSSSSYQTLCNGLGAQNNLSEAIENLRWQAINWSNLTGSGDGPFVPADDSSKSLRDKWQVVNYAREALWKRELSSSQKTTRCALFSTSVTTDTGNVNLKTLCESAVAATTAPDNFWTAMKTNCVDDAYIDMCESDIFSYYWSGWPVIEPAHINKHVEGCVTEKYTVLPAAKICAVTFCC